METISPAASLRLDNGGPPAVTSEAFFPVVTIKGLLSHKLQKVKPANSTSRTPLTKVLQKLMKYSASSLPNYSIYLELNYSVYLVLK